MDLGGRYGRLGAGFVLSRAIDGSGRHHAGLLAFVADRGAFPAWSTSAVRGPTHSRGTPLRASTGDTVWAGTPSSAPIQSGLVARVGGV